MLGYRFLDSGLETALILEDDVDWDIRLRSAQIPLAASAFRQLLPPQRSSHPFRHVYSHHTQYWGNHDAWDLLYLGHCGDYFEPIGPQGLHLTGNYNLTAMPHIIYNDTTLPQHSDLHLYTQMLMDKLGVPPQSRFFHRSRLPLCSFGYAVTRSAARRLLEDLAPPKLAEHGARAFDVALLESCRKGRDTPSQSEPPAHPKAEQRDLPPSPGLRCWTLNSELFHHMPGQSLIGEIGAKVGQGAGGMPPIDAVGKAQVEQRNQTSNIECGFWNGAFAFDDGDMEQLHYLQEHVGRRGECLKDRAQWVAEVGARRKVFGVSRNESEPARHGTPQRPLE